MGGIGGIGLSEVNIIFFLPRSHTKNHEEGIRQDGQDLRDDCAMAANLANPVNPVEKNFVTLRVTS